MELHNIKKLLEKYLDGQTTIQEEKELKQYFSSESIAPELMPYQDMFRYFSKERHVETEREFTIKQKSTKKWLWMAASVVVLLGVSLTFLKQPVQPVQPDDLGTFDNPEIAFEETQKVLQLVAENLNRGKQKIEYIQEYENIKNTIFKN